MIAFVFSCPCCSSHEIGRSGLRWKDWPLVPFGFRPARCAACHSRFHLHLRAVRKQLARNREVHDRQIGWSIAPQKRID